MVRYYQSLDIDSQEKLIIFSDGLMTKEMGQLRDTFFARSGMGFGWGTGATCTVFPNKDYGLHPQMVMKPITANGQPLVKITDDPGKISGNVALAAAIKRDIDQQMAKYEPNF